MPRNAHSIIKSRVFIIVALFFFVTAVTPLIISTLRKLFLPNIILITIDALRSDHLGCYGYGRNTSPHIDALAKEGVLFTDCYATSSSTVYSSPGLLTGRYLEAGDEFTVKFLDDKFRTLASYLKGFGYYTAAFLGNTRYNSGTGAEQGFDYYQTKWEGEGNGRELTSAVMKLLDSYRPKKPFFIWVHYMEVHAPYAFRRDYFARFKDDALYSKNNRMLKLGPYNSKSYLNGWLSLWTGDGYIPRMVFHKGEYSLAYYIACYDTGIVRVDQYIGQILKKVNNNTMLILTADHGESLGEHNTYFSHGANIYDELLHVPLIIKDSRYFKGGNRISLTVSSIDIVPTILSRINPAWYLFYKKSFDGIELKREETIKRQERRYVYSYLRDAWSIRDTGSKFKYILHQGGGEELYRLSDENNNLIHEASLDHVRQELSSALKNWLQSHPLKSSSCDERLSLTETMKNDLKRLGYLQ